MAIALGAVQRAGNQAAHFYQITNFGMGTGFFANVNHMATLLMCGIPFVAALYLSNRSRGRSAQRDSALARAAPPSAAGPKAARRIALSPKAWARQRSG
jgi:hypothetical protein